MQSLLQNRALELGRLKNRSVRFKRSPGTPFLRCSSLNHVTCGHAALVALLVDIALPSHFHFTPLRQEIDDSDTNPVQSAGRLVGTLLEFSAEFELCHDALKRRHIAIHFFRQLFVFFHWNSTTIIFNRNRTVCIDNDIDLTGKTCHGFVD